MEIELEPVGQTGIWQVVGLEPFMYMVLKTETPLLFDGIGKYVCVLKFNPIQILNHDFNSINRTNIKPMMVKWFKTIKAAEKFLRKRQRFWSKMKITMEVNYFNN